MTILRVKNSGATVLERGVLDLENWDAPFWPPIRVKMFVLMGFGETLGLKFADPTPHVSNPPCDTLWKENLGSTPFLGGCCLPDCSLPEDLEAGKLYDLTLVLS